MTLEKLLGFSVPIFSHLKNVHTNDDDTNKIWLFWRTQCVDFSRILKRIAGIEQAL